MEELGQWPDFLRSYSFLSARLGSKAAIKLARGEGRL